MPNIVSGVVTRTGRMSKTITVSVKRHIEHPKLLKQMTRTTNYMVHDEAELAREGDRVRIIHGKPFSKRKHHSLLEILPPHSRGASVSRVMEELEKESAQEVR